MQAQTLFCRGVTPLFALINKMQKLRIMVCLWTVMGKMRPGVKCGCADFKSIVLAVDRRSIVKGDENC